jgi:hypothetical protein
MGISKKWRRILLRIIVALAIITASAFGALASPCANPITAPCTIYTANTTYTLAGSIDGTAGGAAPVIEIYPGLGFVTINCNGYRIENNASPWSNTGAGIYGALVANVTVRNCRFAGSGLQQCVRIENAGSARAFKTILLEGNTCVATEVGFQIDSDALTAQNNYIAAVGGHASCYTGHRSFGINVTGADPRIIGNKIRYVWNRCFLEAVGVSFADLNTNAVLQDNTIENDIVPTSTWIAVWLGSNSGPYAISGNRIDRWYYGFLGYAPVAASTLAGTSLITNTTTLLGASVVSPPWTITP